uniref:Uncharacterized protein n=1 Tax=Vespula pensylvanica TaxID=30213 RepID=A0A834KHM8_VESPE|nr:hypothetical protein H0235_014373 [Vespula pensylvanica]
MLVLTARSLAIPVQTNRLALQQLARFAKRATQASVFAHPSKSTLGFGIGVLAPSHHCARQLLSAAAIRHWRLLHGITVKREPTYPSHPPTLQPSISPSPLTHAFLSTAKLISSPICPIRSWSRAFSQHLALFWLRSSSLERGLGISKVPLTPTRISEPPQHERASLSIGIGIPTGDALNFPYEVYLGRPRSDLLASRMTTIYACPSFDANQKSDFLIRSILDGESWERWERFGPEQTTYGTEWASRWVEGVDRNEVSTGILSPLTSHVSPRYVFWLHQVPFQYGI